MNASELLETVLGAAMVGGGVFGFVLGFAAALIGGKR